MTEHDTFAPTSRAARIRRLLTLLLLTAALVAAVAAANTTATTDSWWPRTGDAFTTPTAGRTALGAPEPGTTRPQPAACGASLDRVSCATPATRAPGAEAVAGPVLAAPVTPSVWTTALLLLPVAAGLTVVGRTRSGGRKADR
ncbi:hypothetical protein ACFCZ6_14130 [Streptomyces hydrogenans]|uniref:hypothetical protein n=1 Tax=Streptomyces hydrogenans TaxID=1873719 RepID=UPI0035D7F4DF